MNNGWLIFGILLVVLFGGWACRSGSAAGETKGGGDATAQDTTCNLLDLDCELIFDEPEPIEVDPRDTMNIPPAVRAAARKWYGEDRSLLYRGTAEDGTEVYSEMPITNIAFLWKENRVVSISGVGVTGVYQLFHRLKKLERQPCTVAVSKKMTGREDRRFRKSILGLVYEDATFWYFGRKADGTELYGVLYGGSDIRSSDVVSWFPNDSVTETVWRRVDESLQKQLGPRVPLAVQEAADRWAGGQFQPLERYGVTPDGTEVYVVKMPEGVLTGLPELFIWKRGRVRNVSGLAALALLRQAEEE